MSDAPDQAVRNRVTAAPPQSYWLSAGAGAGKTEILVTRIANMIAAGYDSSNIIAITFTEKAAGDLKKRVMQRLRKSGLTSQPGLPERFTNLQSMFVGTIHALARRIVRNAPLTACIEPDPEIVDAITADKRIKQAIRRWQQQPDVADLFAATIELEALTRNKIPELAGQILERPDFVIPNFESGKEIESAQYALNRAVINVEAMQHHCIHSQDALFLILSALLEEVSRTEQYDSEWTTFFDIHNRLLPLVQTKSGSLISTRTKGSAKNWTLAIDQARSAVNELFQAVQLLHDAYASRLIALWYEPLNELRAIHAEILRKNGEARFDDLIEGAIALLSDSEASTPTNAEKIHLDEAQDTDPRQTIFLERLLAKVKPVAVALFAVGDVKQSVYLFRNADVAQFAERLRATLTGLNPDAVQHLTANFRSTPGIVRFINQLFSGLFGDSYTPMDAVVETSSAPSLVVIDNEYPSRTSIDDIETDGANAVAGYLAQCREQGGLPVTTNNEIAWHEIAILLSNSSKASFYETALRNQHIPYLNETPRGFFANDLVADIANALAVIADPNDGIGLLGALRGSLFGISDLTIWEWQQSLQAASSEAHLQLMPPQPGFPEKLNRVLDGMWNLHGDAATESIPVTIQRLYRLSNIIERTWYDGSGAAARGKLEGILTAARRMPPDTPLREFAEWLRTGRSEPSREAQLIFPEEPAVRLLTVHGAKGLEFEWVIVHGAGTWGESRRNNSLGMVLTNEAGEVELGFQKWFRTNGFATASQQQKEKEDAEQLRLLYVACTRAKRRLILPTLEKTRKTPRDINYRQAIHTAVQALPTDEYSIRTVSDCIVQPVSPKISALTANPLLPPKPIAPPELRAVSSFHELNRDDQFPESFKLTGWDRESSMVFGSYLHALLSQLSFDTEQHTVEKIAGELLREFAIAEGLRDECYRLGVEYSLRFLQSESVSSWKAATIIEREYPILSQSETDHTILIGTIDLLLKLPDRWVIVDYKSDVLTNLEQLLTMYSKQVEIYCQAIRRLTSEPVEGFLWHLPSGTPIAVPLS